MRPDLPFIRTEQLTHRFPAHPQPVLALDQVNLTLNNGEYVALVGANGSGKSTLARHFNALLQPTSGQVWVKGANTRQMEQLRAIRRAVAMVFQNPENQFVATVAEEDAAFGPENFGVPPAELRPRVDKALAAVGLSELRLRAPHELSAGQQQRLAIAGALAIEPEALVLDEATALLDPRGKQAVTESAAELNRQGLLVAAITQAMDEAAQAARIIVLERGRVVREGTPREVFSGAELLRSLGLGLPPFAEMAHRLNAFCPEFPANLLTLPELVEAIAARAAQVNRAPVAANAASRLARKPSGEPIIRTRGLRHTFLRGTPRASEALRGIDLEIYPGEIVGLAGATGSGKSTLVQHLNGLLRPRPDEGSVVVNGLELSDPHVDARPLRQQIGLLFQFSERQLFERYVGDDIAFGPRQLGCDRAETRRRVQQAMEQVGLDFEAFKDRRTLTLSGGEKRRAALAGVLALEPRVLVLDEPTAGLDPQGRAQLLDLLKRWRAENGLTVVLVSHHMDEIAELCDRVYVLQSGRVAFEGDTRSLFGQKRDLAGLGLVPPPAVQLAHVLRERGLPLSAEPLTVEEAVAACRELMGDG